MVTKALIPFRARVEIFTPFSFKTKPNTLEVSAKLCQTLALVIQLTIKISEKTEERRFGVILAPFSS